MISQLDIGINGRSIQNISQYSYLYNTISDWVYNGQNMHEEVGGLADPSVMTYYNKGKYTLGEVIQFHIMMLQMLI
jgi:hypothetical protein